MTEGSSWMSDGEKGDGSGGPPAGDSGEGKRGPAGGAPGGAPPGRGGRPYISWIFLGFAAVYLLFWWFAPPAGTPVSYSEFRDLVKTGYVARVTVRGGRISGELTEPITREVEGREEAVTLEEFSTQVPSFGDEELMPLLERHGVTVRALPESGIDWSLILAAGLPILILIMLGSLFARRIREQAGSMMQMGKSRAKLYDRAKEVKTTFDDVAGAEGAKTELAEIIEFLKDPTRYRQLGGKPPKGVLLVGPPGTGKTLLARAAAGEAEVPFLSITGSDFMEMFVGVGASRVRDLFNDARRNAPGIVFIDELDSIGRQRGTGLGGGHDEREQTLNQMLSEMDGFEPNEGVIVMAATNRPDILDPALLRPGRFDRRITVNLPEVGARKAILEIHARGKPLAADVDLDSVARSTPGFSGADLENLFNEAALLAAREKKKEIGMADLDRAQDKILMGLKRKGIALSGEELRTLSYHEAGHAVVAAVLPHTDPIHKVTVVPRGKAMGVTRQVPADDRHVHSREYLMDRLSVMMGGRAAERLVLETMTTGSENDLKQAMELARRMVLDFGMGARLQDVALGGEGQNVFLGQELARGRKFSDETAREVDEEIQRLVDEAAQRAEEVIRKHRGGLDRVAEALQEQEEIPGSRVTEILEASGETPGGRSGPSAGTAG